MIRTQSGKIIALVVATGLLTINFWAWSLVSPLAKVYVQELSLSPLAISLLLAAPVIVGSLGRIPLGLLTDRYGGRRVFAVLCWVSSIPVLALSFAGSYSQLLITVFCLGIAGASFAIGVPFVNSWFPTKQRGLALGIYGMGNIGTSISGVFTPRLVLNLGRQETFLLVALLLFFAGTAMAIWGRDAPGWMPAKAAAASRLESAIKWPPTRKLSILYAVTFGAFIAFGTYLPLLLFVVYKLEVTDAAARAAGFVLLATLARPFGGWLSDRIGGIIVIRGVLVIVLLLAVTTALELSLMPFGTIAYLALAATLGVGNGAIFAMIGHWCNPKLVGSVTGVVGAAGGLGGFFPPLLMGVSFQYFHSYAAALILLAAVCLLIVGRSKSFLNF